MKLSFIYDRSKDVWCLLNKGKSSNNSTKQTKVYQELVSTILNPLEDRNVSLFIDKYLKEKDIQIEKILNKSEENFKSIINEFTSIAECIFGVVLEENITAYLTINNRCPYNIKENWFFISIHQENSNPTIMHELWHFYTWKRFGEFELKNDTKEKYNEIKEALTVLLNIECSHLFPNGAVDMGYPQHQDLRARIVEWWNEDQDIDYIWKKATEYLS